jgi:hypothetical protein
MAAALTFPAGYWTTSGRNEFGDRCFVLHHEHFGELSDHDCYAEAINAAVEHSDELADEASAQAAAVAEAAYEATLDTYRTLIAGMPIHVAPGDDAARGERRARNALLKAIDGIGAGLGHVAQASSLSRLEA